MAETLGSIIDKFTIKCIRRFYLQQMIESDSEKFSKDELQTKLQLLEDQIVTMREEIEGLVDDSIIRGEALRDEKLKLYNKRDQMDQIGENRQLGQAIEGLAKKNFELWNLEDEARREDVPLDYIGQVKRKIDATNQQRNDFIDCVDQLFSDLIEEKSKKV